MVEPGAHPSPLELPNSGVEGVAIYHLDGSLQGVDDRFLELSGLSENPSILERFDQLILWLHQRLSSPEGNGSPDGNGSPVGNGSPSLSPDLAKDATVELEIEVEGKKALDLRLRPLRGRQGIFGRIVSLRAGAEHQRLQQRIAQAQKMEAIGRLVGGISHDFNNLLTVIRGYCDFSREQLSVLDAELLLSQKKKCASLRNSLVEISKAGERASRLTRQLLAYSRQQVVTPQILDLNAELYELEKMLERLLGDGVRLELEVGIPAATVRADRGQMHQMIMNLVINASDAMPGGGTIKLSTEAFHLDEEFASRFDYPVEVGDKVMLRVRDSGSGIAPEAMPRIFEPFFTTKEVGRGTGLGLSTVYGIVKQSGGYIWVESAQGRGTEFRICLPAASGIVSSRKDHRKEEAISPSGENILVVDDDHQVRQVLERLLENAGYRVHAVSSPAAALAAQAEGHRFDLVITDLLMGEMDGTELARRLEAGQGDLRVLYISGYDPDAYKRRGVMPEGADFLAKPLDSESLRRKISEILKSP